MGNIAQRFMVCVPSSLSGDELEKWEKGLMENNDVVLKQFGIIQQRDNAGKLTGKWGWIVETKDGWEVDYAEEVKKWNKRAKLFNDLYNILLDGKDPAPSKECWKEGKEEWEEKVGRAMVERAERLAKGINE